MKNYYSGLKAISKDGTKTSRSTKQQGKARKKKKKTKL